MTREVILACPGNEGLGRQLAEQGHDWVDVEVRAFPDGESYIRIHGDLKDRDVTIVCTLHRPDRVFLQLALIAHTARDLGARRLCLVAPYLSYMRQDERFHAGEAITSSYLGGMFSQWFDEMITVDPHLHRWQSLDEIYTIPTFHVSAAPSLARWAAEHVDSPLIVGPDSESEQWASALARDLDVPYVVLEKVRRGDRDVSISGDLGRDVAGYTPVLVDDIVSTGRTMAAAVSVLLEQGFKAPCCVGIHAVFSDDASRHVLDAGASALLTCNTIAHESNAIDVWREIVACWSSRHDQSESSK